MRSSTIHVRPLVALLGAAFCAGAALAANYTLTNTTVEWPSSNEAENVSGNRFTIVGDVTVVITNVPVANVSLGALRANMVVTDGATLTVDFTAVEASRIRIWGTLVAHGTGKIRMKGDTTRIAYGLDGTAVQPLPQAVFDAPDFAFVDASGDALDIPLTFSGPSAVRRWPSCGWAFSAANICLIGDEGVRLAPDEGTDAITLSSAGLRNLVLVDDTALAPSTKVNVPTDCGLYMKPATYSTNSLSWAATMWGTNSTDVVLSGGKLSLQSMPDHVLLGDITGAGTVAMEVARTRVDRDERTWLLGNISFEGSVRVSSGSSATYVYDCLSIGQSSVPGHATNKVTLAAWSQLSFVALDGTFAPNVTIGSLAGTDETSLLHVMAGQTVTINAFTGMFRLLGGGTVVFGPDVGPVASCRFGDGLVYTKGNSPSEFSVLPYVNNATGTNTLTLGGTPLFTGASTSFVVQAAAGERMRVLADGNVPVIAGGAGTAVIETRDWRDRAALWIDPSTTEPGGFGTCAKDEWWSVISTSISNRFVNEAHATGGGLYIEYMPDCRPDRTYYFGRNSRNYQHLYDKTNPYAECLPSVFAYQKFNGCNGLTTICCVGSSRRLPIAKGVVKEYAESAIPAKMVIMVFGSQDGGGKALVGTSDGAFARTAGLANGLTTSASANIWLDGVKVTSPDAQTLNGGWQIVSIDTTGHNVNGFGWAKNYNDAGGQNYGEILVFTNALSDVERTSVESYLAEKWGISTYNGSAAATVRAVGRTGTLEVAPDTQVTLGGCYAGMIDVKAGATLTIAEPLPPTADELPSSGRVGWFDPDAEGSLYQPNVSWARREEVQAVAPYGLGINDITNGTTFLWAPGSRRPFRVLGARGWGPVRAWIDCQEIDVSSAASDTGNCLRPRQYPNTNPTGGDGGSNMTIPCRTVFMASDSFRGGGSPVLGGVSGGNGIAARTAGDYKAPIWASGTHARITGGETRLNGVRVASPTQTGFTGAPEVFSFSTTADQLIGCFGNLYNTQKGVNYGEVFGEILLYNQVLTGADRLAVEAYLMGKWCGTLPEGYSDLREATVSAGSGTVTALAAKLPMFGDGFTGTVVVPDTTFDFTLDGAAGTVDRPLIARGATLSLPAAVTINVVCANMAGSDGTSVPLIDVAAFASPVTWTFNAANTGGKTVRLNVEGGQVLLEVIPSGTTILFR
ncbi:MAG: hypothetical protein IJL17_04635 [Kiritimatiellae bacterium]|nr:hypothetical protein [Kiritimatiellia bacterium]